MRTVDGQSEWADADATGAFTKAPAPGLKGLEADLCRAAAIHPSHVTDWSVCESQYAEGVRRLRGTLAAMERSDDLAPPTRGRRGVAGFALAGLGGIGCSVALMMLVWGGQSISTIAAAIGETPTSAAITTAAVVVAEPQSRPNSGVAIIAPPPAPSQPGTSQRRATLVTIARGEDPELAPSATAAIEPAIAVPALTPTPAPSAAPVSTNARADADLGRIHYARFAIGPASERKCLARAIYYEARGEAFEGKVAVAQVVLNRVRSKKWPQTVCGVVNQGASRGEKCQFSYACFGNLSEPSGAMYAEAELVAEQALAGQAWLRELEHATHYHTTAVNPVWRLGLTPLVTIGNHIFYAEAGGVVEREWDGASYQRAAQVNVQTAASKRKIAVRPPNAPADSPSTQAQGSGKQAASQDWSEGAFGR